MASETVRRAYGFYVFNVFSNPKKHYFYVFLSCGTCFLEHWFRWVGSGGANYWWAHKKLVIVGHFYRVCQVILRSWCGREVAKWGLVELGHVTASGSSSPTSFLPATSSDATRRTCFHRETGRSRSCRRRRSKRLPHIRVNWLNFHMPRQKRSLASHTHTRLTALFPGLPGWAGTRKVKPIWILL